MALFAGIPCLESSWIYYGFHAAASVEFTKSQVVAAIPGTFFCAWYASQKHWLANNILGIAFCIQVWFVF